MRIIVALALVLEGSPVGCHRSVRPKNRGIGIVLQKLGTWFLIAGFFVWLMLAVAIYVYGLYLAGMYHTSSALLVSAFVPVVGQALLIWSIWSATGIFFNSYTIAVLSWIALGVLLGNIIQRR